MLIHPSSTTSSCDGLVHESGYHSHHREANRIVRASLQGTQKDSDGSVHVLQRWYASMLAGQLSSLMRRFRRCSLLQTDSITHEIRTNGSHSRIPRYPWIFQGPLRWTHQPDGHRVYVIIQTGISEVEWRLEESRGCVDAIGHHGRMSQGSRVLTAER